MVASDDELPFLDPGLTARAAATAGYETITLREADRIEERKRHKGILLSPPGRKQKKGKKRSHKKKKYIPYTSRTHSQVEATKKEKVRRFSVNTVTSIPEENSEDVVSSDPDIETVEYVTNNQNTVQSIHQIFAELDELVVEEGEQMWEEKSRWLKFEQDMYRAADKWSKPRVATLTLQSLINLRKCINSGTVLLGMNAFDLESVIELLLDRLVSQALINSSGAAKLKGLLLKRHVHTGNAKLKLKNLSNGQGLLSRVADTFTPISSPPESRRPSRANSEQDLSKTKQHFLRKLPADAEASNVMVGQVDYLTQTLCVVIRLKHSILLGDMTEVPIPTRFMFLLLCPTTEQHTDHMEIGRAASTLFTDEMFYKAAYTAKSKADLIQGIDRFLEKAIVIPPGEWSPNMKITLPDQDELNSEHLTDKDEEEEDKLVSKPFKKPFAGIISDTRALSKRWCKDWKRGVHLIPSLVSLQLAVVLLCYTLLLSDSGYAKLDITTFSCLASMSVCGVLLSLTSCQPLVVCSVSLPVVMWEVAASRLCGMLNVEYSQVRTIIGLTCGVTLLLSSSLNIANLFTVLSMFLYESVLCAVCLGLVVVVCLGGLRAYHMGPVLLQCSLILVLAALVFLKLWHGLSSSTLFKRKMREIIRLLDGTTLLLLTSLLIYILPLTTTPYSTQHLGPLYLFSSHLPPRTWLIALLLGLLLFLLTLLQLSSVFNWVTQPKHKLGKRCNGKYSDQLLCGVIMIVCSVYHLPYLVPDPFLTCVFIQTVSVRSKTPPHNIIYIKDQRVSQLLAHITLLLPALLLPHLHLVAPVPLCYGVVIFYCGKCISDTQFYERIKLFAQAEKYQPDSGYVTKTPVRVIHLYTLAQIVVVVMLTICLTAPYSPLLLPLVMLIILGARNVLMPNILYEYFLHSLEDSVSPPLLSPPPMCEPSIKAFGEELTKVNGDHKSDVEKDGKPTFSTQVIFDCLTDDEPKADECYQFPDIIVPKDQADLSTLDCIDGTPPRIESPFSVRGSMEFIPSVPNYYNANHGVTFLDAEETFLDNEPLFIDHGPALDPSNGPTVLDHGPTFLDHAPTFLDHGPAMDISVGPTFLDHGLTFLDNDELDNRVVNNSNEELDNHNELGQSKFPKNIP